MVDQPASIELSVPSTEMEAAVRRVCEEWGVDRADVRVEVLDAPIAGEPGEGAPEGAPDLVRVRIERLNGPAEDAGPLDPNLENARRVLSELLAHMDVRATVHASWGAPAGDVRPMVLDVRGDDLGMLIGRRGETLAALQYVTRLILSKQSGEAVDVVVDVQGHKARREEQLRRMARRVAEQAVQRGRTMSLEPMPAHERRIVHLELRDHPQVRTESVGDGHHRKVTIIPTTQ